jgi:hypothetical protein
MAGLIVQLGEFDIINCYFRGAPLPTGFQLLLCDYDIGSADTLATLVGEPAGNGYARQYLNPNTTDWPSLVLTGGNYQVTSRMVTFEATGGSWGPVITCCLATLGIAIPAGLVVVPQGATGACTYEYAVTALSAYGETLACTPYQIINGNTTLTASNYTALSWNTVAGAIAYKVYRIQSNGSITTLGLIGTVVTTTFNDTGVAGNGVMPPQTDSSGKLLNAYPLDNTTTLNNGESQDVTVNFTLAASSN